MNRKLKGGKLLHDGTSQPVLAQSHLVQTAIECAPRTFHALDIENLVGGTRASKADVHRLMQIYREQAFGVRQGDVALIGASHYAATSYMFALGDFDAEWTLGSGSDGAELSMMDRMDLPYIARHFDRIVVGSGDHIWLDTILKSKELGLRVAIFTGKGKLSYELSSLNVPLCRLRDVKRDAVIKPGRIHAIRTGFAIAA